ncbi:MAG: hypothetical protein BV459_00220 [Thermoplasmata archaeon M11B2D]|nr:MAG: hypothetical protein BV459_00220 [Thermoplasmata archaeon M11B2D]
MSNDKLERLKLAGLDVVELTDNSATVVVNPGDAAIVIRPDNRVEIFLSMQKPDDEALACNEMVAVCIAVLNTPKLLSLARAVISSNID